MSDQKTTQEPSMEEILASIRRIISEDGATAEGATDAPASDDQDDDQVGAQDDTLTLTDEVEDDDVLELTEVVEEAPEPAAEEDDDPFAPAEDEDVAAMADPAIEDPVTEDDDPFADFGDPAGDAAPEEDDRLVSEVTAAAAGATFAKLADRPAETPAASATPWPLGAEGRSVEDVVRELLRPMLKEWLDDNLPEMVERIVEREVEKLSRTGRR
ncbi:DUF2497 domain-containing protein [Inquilinus sp. CAU 1745]|uniref:DUF2497 domain-containing protein n=1 Tax=Inquilinus sp. CAU 1745 TaxID=3140369 RepID=UPI00325A96C4